MLPTNFLKQLFSQNFSSFSNFCDFRYAAPTVEQPETFHYEAGFEPWNIVEADWTVDDSGDTAFYVETSTAHRDRSIHIERACSSVCSYMY